MCLILAGLRVRNDRYAHDEFLFSSTLGTMAFGLRHYLARATKHEPHKTKTVQSPDVKLATASRQFRMRHPCN
jgi:hypothetical protein